MNRIAAMRQLGLALLAIAALCVSAAGAQNRHAASRTERYRSSAPSYGAAGAGYRAYAPNYGASSQMRGQYGATAPMYRNSGPQQGFAGRQQGYGQAPQQQGYQGQSPAPVERRQPGPMQTEHTIGPMQPGQLPQVERRAPGQGNGPRGEHLAQWMNQHRNLTPEQQQQALGREPGFSQLPPQTQQRMRNRLSQLNAMPVGERERILSYNERMEHLSLDQRAEVRGSLEQLGALPLEQRRAVARSFRELRALPPEQRAAALNSPQYQWMSPAQRSTLNGLMRVEPLLPPSEQQQPR